MSSSPEQVPGSRPSERHHRVLVLGGGSAGITVAARLRRGDRALDVGLVEPSETHWYQPLWTLVGRGVVDTAATRRPMAGVMPSGVTWHRDRVARIDPGAQRVELGSGAVLTYDALVVALGIRLAWDLVDGAAEALATPHVASVYTPDSAERVWKAMRAFRGGSAVFTNPDSQIKCGGAPQKIMYLADAYWRKEGLAERTKVIGAFAGTVMLGVPEINETLNRIVAERGIDMRFRHDLRAIDPERREARFRHLDREEDVTIPYDFLHVTPPQRAPDPVAESPLAVDEGPHRGFVEVDHGTLQHLRYPNVFAVGDAAALPTAKTGAAVRKQAPVVVSNLTAFLEGRPLEARYDGYSSCPLLTDVGKLVLAEFTYGNTFAPTFPVDQTKERLDMYMLKRHVLPQLYWHGMLKGRA
jgi:sulfide:quinone oxidoreductase